MEIIKWFDYIKVCDKKMEEVSNLSRGQWSVNKNVFETPIMRPFFCGFNDAGTNKNILNRKLNFKNNAPFTSCISKTNDTFKDSTEVLDLVMLTSIH